ncbi:formyltransferase family protein [Shewanella sedimentimangrovi]|uniref:UDP-glucuronic acid dehydrogenase n=1 Tax=Shewanella sedimentimangrovi TaxID=2814293 RepID=A0ABX7QX78_9GAMM|nr:formyltransferase family protein [Shewanella sedimentimangrovi]QSX36117.1 UDP-glucuronic acid dehydrogenase [Shewanella sedimentimangrovi]
MNKNTVTILCTDPCHPVFPYLSRWRALNGEQYDVQLVNRTTDITRFGGILFLVSCSELLTAEFRQKFDFSLVLHASELPEGRGWSPHIWDVIKGCHNLTLTLLNAEDKVDTGDIWHQLKIPLNGTELYDEINHLLFEAELTLITWACENIWHSRPRVQAEGGSYYRKRTPQDSRIDPHSTLAAQFDLLRVCDPERFPAFFEFRGKRYNIRLERED